MLNLAISTVVLACCALNCGNVFAADSGSSETALRIDFIGRDTSHAVAFTALLNGDTQPEGLRGCRVVVAYPHGSRDITPPKKPLIVLRHHGEA